MKIKRSLGESQKRIVAANQKWECAHCNVILSSAYQVDHVIPLWNNGPDTLENCVAVCPSCHALKTQKESIQRADLKRAQRADLAKAKQKEFEETVRFEETSKLKLVDMGNGLKQCSECSMKLYGIFKHKTCKAVEERIHSRLFKKPKIEEPNNNPFIRFLYIKT